MPWSPIRWPISDTNTSSSLFVLILFTLIMRKNLCFDRNAVANILAPIDWAYWIAVKPTPPAAELIRMQLPDYNLACIPTAKSTVRNTMRS